MCDWFVLEHFKLSDRHFEDANWTETPNENGSGLYALKDLFLRNNFAVAFRPCGKVLLLQPHSRRCTFMKLRRKYTRKLDKPECYSYGPFEILSGNFGESGEINVWPN